MREENIALVKKLYDAFAKGDLQTILDHLSEDVDWRMEGPSQVPFAGIRRGKSEVASFFQVLATTQTGQKLQTDEYIGDGDTVVTVGRYSGTVVATGKKLDNAVVHVFTIKSGKVTRFLDFGDTAQMLAAYTAG